MDRRNFIRRTVAIVSGFTGLGLIPKLAKPEVMENHAVRLETIEAITVGPAFTIVYNPDYLDDANWEQLNEEVKKYFNQLQRYLALQDYKIGEKWECGGIKWRNS